MVMDTTQQKQLIKQKAPGWGPFVMSLKRATYDLWHFVLPSPQSLHYRVYLADSQIGGLCNAWLYSSNRATDSPRLCASSLSVRGAPGRTFQPLAGQHARGLHVHWGIMALASNHHPKGSANILVPGIAIGGIRPMQRSKYGAAHHR